MPCQRCGSTERYSSGRCAVCTRASNQRWKANNREAHRAGSRRWEQANPEVVRAKGREYGRRHKARRAAYRKQWDALNPDKRVEHFHRRRARIEANGGSYTVGEWRQLCVSYGDRCLCCGRDDVLLTVDHVIPIHAGGRNEIANIQPLCGPCNSSKGTRAVDYRDRWSRGDIPEQLSLFGGAA